MVSIYKSIEERLNRTIGLDVNAVGPSTVAMAVRSRMRARGIRETAAYDALLASSQAEWQRLVEAVVVPETWFFRNVQPFQALGKWAMEEWLPAHPGEVLRLLSMPCSTGEEPFSMAMALLDAGLAADRFIVEAIDISDEVLKRAHEGLYGRNSFRGQDLGYRDRYFQEIKPGGPWRLETRVRRQVQFRQANLLDPSLSAGMATQQVIFCRNLLIYLDPASQRRVIEAIGLMLAEDGILFTGHAEAYGIGNLGFRSAHIPMAFAFRKTAAPIAPIASIVREPIPRNPQSPPLLPLWPPSKTGNPGKPDRSGTPRAVHLLPPPLFPLHPVPRDEEIAAELAAGPQRLLDECQKLADTGSLEAAEEKGLDCLRIHGPGARAYYLLGLLKDAAGAAGEAEAFYRKALYLEPDHHEALAHLALLARKSGQSESARRLQERLRRLQHKKSAAEA